MKKLRFIFCISVITTIFFSCSSGPKVSRTDTLISGEAKIAADECLAPIIQEELNVFEALNEDAYITPIYASENEAFNLLLSDSVRLIVATRELTAYETNIIAERSQKPRTQKIAIDGIALIVNKANKDSLITTGDIKRIMTGEARNWKDIYPNSTLGEIAIGFDSPNSSTVRFIRDSICSGKPLGDNVKAKSADQKTSDKKESTPNQKVIDFVASTPNALGIIGVNWISNPSDTTNLSFINNIQVMSVSRDIKATPDNSYKPFAAYLALDYYPLKRDVYIIITDASGGLPSGFVNFVAKEQGQRIIHKAGLYPATVPTRLVRVNSSL